MVFDYNRISLPSQNDKPKTSADNSIKKIRVFRYDSFLVNQPRNFKTITLYFSSCELFWGQIKTSQMRKKGVLLRSKGKMLANTYLPISYIRFEVKEIERCEMSNKGKHMEQVSKKDSTT